MSTFSLKGQRFGDVTVVDHITQINGLKLCVYEDPAFGILTDGVSTVGRVVAGVVENFDELKRLTPGPHGYYVIESFSRDGDKCFIETAYMQRDLALKTLDGSDDKVAGMIRLTYPTATGADAKIKKLIEGLQAIEGISVLECPHKKDRKVVADVANGTIIGYIEGDWMADRHVVIYGDNVELAKKLFELI